MWTGSCFEGDENELVMDVQHDAYAGYVAAIWDRARRAYAAAESLVERSSPLGAVARLMERFDHRTFQDAHDLMAAGFRLRRPDLGQLRLPLDPETASQDHIERLKCEWSEFFWRELNALCTDREFVHAVLVATVHANSDKGLAAERELRLMLTARYGLPSRGADESVARNR